jgi:hypothetical protein
MKAIGVASLLLMFALLAAFLFLNAIGVNDYLINIIQFLVTLILPLGANHLYYRHIMKIIKTEKDSAGL